jgi:hypothetical protein
MQEAYAKFYTICDSKLKWDSKLKTGDKIPALLSFLSPTGFVLRRRETNVNE